MIKINIKKDNKVQVKSFIKKIDLMNYVLNYIGWDLSGSNTKTTANKIWNLNVGSSLKINNGHFETIISMSGKSPYHNTDHGKQIYGS